MINFNDWQSTFKVNPFEDFARKNLQNNLLRNFQQIRNAWPKLPAFPSFEVFDEAQKKVAFAPNQPFPKLPAFPSFEAFDQAAQQQVAFNATKSLPRLPAFPSFEAFDQYMSGAGNQPSYEDGDPWGLNGPNMYLPGMPNFEW